MFMGWGKQIRDCQGSIPTADGKGQGFIARVEMTLHWTMSEMMDHLASYSSGTEAEPQLRKQVNKWVQIQCRQRGTWGKWRLCRDVKRILAVGEVLYSLSPSDDFCFRLYLKLDGAELMKWTHARICFSNTNGEWTGDDNWCGGNTIQKQPSWKLISGACSKNFFSVSTSDFFFFWEKASVIFLLKFDSYTVNIFG